MPIESYDVVVIGGGIHGVGVAQAAAARGYSVLVLEQTGLASGTSSRSSKLIHGGLRYLENWQFGLVKKALHERALLLKLAPDLVKLQPFFVPIYAHSYRRPWELRTGLSLYAVLGGLHKQSLFRRIDKSAWQQLDGLNTEGLQAVFQYWDAQTDDVALTKAVMASARTLGAQLCMPAKFLSAQLESNNSVINYEYQGHTTTCTARCLVNAAGPWIHQVMKRITPTCSELQTELVQGTHIVVEGALTQGIYYMEAPSDRRAVFAMPWKNQLLVGTTETIYHGEPGAVVPLATERDYLLATLVQHFPQYKAIDSHTIVHEFAGLRVLPSGDGTPFSRPRDTILHVDRHNTPRLLTIYGGKLTAYRATATAVMDKLALSLPRRRVIADTATLPLHPVE